MVEMVDSAKSLGLDDIELIALIGWVQGEGYWGIGDPYLGYLSACVVINCILDGYYGRGQAVIDRIASWGSYYSEGKQISRYTSGTTNSSVMKLTYLALTYLQKGIHACYGPGYKPDKVFYDPDYKVGNELIYVW